MQIVWLVFSKETKEVWRDLKSIAIITLVSVLAGPLLLLMLAKNLASFEARAERNIIVVQGIEHAPSLQNYMQRQTATIHNAPVATETALVENQIIDPILIIPPDFEKNWLNNAPVTLTIMTNSSNPRIQAGVTRLKRLVNGFIAEKNAMYLALHGISTSTAQIVQVEDYDVANRQAEAAKVFGMLPFFLVLAGLYGVWSLALDMTVGERDRGTWIPLLVATQQLNHVLLGKWLSVSLFGAIITTIAIMSFIPAQSLMSGEILKSMFAFSWAEALLCMTILLPLVMLFAAILMWVGVKARSTKQAQATATGLMLITSILPLLMQMKEGQMTWGYQVLPVIAQHQHILTMIKGETTQLGLIALSAMVNFILALAFIWLAKQNLKKGCC